jgi:hypothetical protein
MKYAQLLVKKTMTILEIYLNSSTGLAPTLLQQLFYKPEKPWR